MELCIFQRQYKTLYPQRGSRILRNTLVIKNIKSKKNIKPKKI